MNKADADRGRLAYGEPLNSLLSTVRPGYRHVDKSGGGMPVSRLCETISSASLALGWNSRTS